MAAPEIIRDDTDPADTGDATEPATSHDVAEGGLLGAVGGAVVGMLAGGPIGAVIGAVVGGAASAGAVDIVDKYDHDFARTADGDVPESLTDDTAAPAIVGLAAVSPLDFTDPIGFVTPMAMVSPAVFVAPADSEAEPTDLTQTIRERAYAIYEQRGRVDGRDVEDWLEAERAISSV